MKEIETNKFKNKKADLIEYPPVDGEDDGSITPKKKKLKYMPQLGRWIVDNKDEV